MPRRPRSADPTTLPADIAPPDFVERHGLIDRLILAPMRHLTRPRAWAPLTDTEWEAVAPYLWIHGCGMAAPGEARPGRKLPDPRGRLDAIFRAVTLKRPEAQGGGRAAWSALPEAFGKADTVSRTFRRWAAVGLWVRLLEEVADRTCPPALRRLTYFICCAFRRAIRVIGRDSAIALARRLKLHSALPAPSTYLPDPGLSEIYTPVTQAVLRRIAEEPGWRPPSGTLRMLRSATLLIAGRSRIRRDWEPA
jgi:transposase